MRTLRELEHVDEIAAKGRQRFGLQVSNARVIGQLVVTTGRRHLETLLRGLRAPSAPAEHDLATVAPDAVVPAPAPTPGALNDDEDAHLAIPDYRALSASQVVRRLDGLGPEELEALYRYELATRGRRTILYRAQQLLGHEAPPVPPTSD
jgi:hypothetical protein